MDLTRASVLEDPPHLGSDDSAPKIEPYDGSASAVSTTAIVPIQINHPQSTAFLSSFTLFPKLPFELRQMVWLHALPSPQVIFIEPYCVFTRHRPAVFIGLVWTCRESRLMCMEHYKLLKLPLVLYQTQLIPSAPYVPLYFSAAKDICLLELLVLHHFSDTVDPAQRTFRDSIRVLAIDPLELSIISLCPEFMGRIAKIIVSSIAKCTNLQRLVLLRGPRLENDMAAMMRELTSDGARQGLDRIPLVLEDFTRVTVLSYEYDNPRKALYAKKKALLAYAG